jgi:hypothetical protein
MIVRLIDTDTCIYSRSLSRRSTSTHYTSFIGLVGLLASIRAACLARELVNGSAAAHESIEALETLVKYGAKMISG